MDTHVEEDIFDNVVAGYGAPPAASSAAAAAAAVATYGGRAGGRGAGAGAAASSYLPRKRAARGSGSAHGGDGPDAAAGGSAAKRPRTKSVQLTLDLGQRSRGLVWCDRCALRYNEGSPEDVAAHAAAHRRAVRPLQYARLGAEDVVPALGGRAPLPPRDRILVFRVAPAAAGAPPLLGRIFRRMGEDLGGDIAGAITAPSAVYVYITRVETGSEAVGGCLVVEPVGRAACFVSGGGGEGGSEGAAGGGGGGGDDDSVAGGGGSGGAGARRADMGVLYVWVDALLRCRGIATHLLDAARRSFLYGADVPVARVAFSQPTEDGRRFAASYTCSDGAVLVYKKDLRG